MGDRERSGGERPIGRREALKRAGAAAGLAAAGALAGAGGCGFEGPRRGSGGTPGPGAGKIGFTVQTWNYAGMLDVEIERLADLGAEFVRVPLNTGDPSGGRTIVRRFLDAGLSLLGITAGYEGLRTDAFGPVPVDGWETYLEDLLRIYPEVRFWQILNEPRSFEHISEETYVRTYLASAYRLLKDHDPSITVVAAAPVGHRGGPAQFRRMVESGLEMWCDVAAVHVYSSDPENYAAEVPNPIWVTETGSNDGAATQLSFFRSKVPRMVEGSLGAERVFWYDLLDEYSGDATAPGFGLLALDGRPANEPLYEEIRAFNRRAAE